MTSIQEELRAYSHALEDYFSHFSGLLMRKRDIEASFQKGAPPSVDATTNLLAIIGLNTFMHSAENIDEWTLRHTVWEFTQLIKELREIKPTYDASLHEALENPAPSAAEHEFVVHLSQEKTKLFTVVDYISERLGKLSIIYHNEVKAIQDRRWEIYVTNVQQEHELLAEILEKRHEINTMQANIEGYLKELRADASTWWSKVDIKPAGYAFLLLMVTAILGFNGKAVPAVFSFLAAIYQSLRYTPHILHDRVRRAWRRFSKEKPD